MGISAIVKGLAAIAIVALIGTVLTTFQTVGKLKAENKSITALLEESTNVTKKLQEKIDEQVVDINRITETNGALTSERDKAFKDLEHAHGRMDRIASARPELVSRLATNATNKLMRDFHCATGGLSEYCSSPKAPPTPP